MVIITLLFSMIRRRSTLLPDFRSRFTTRHSITFLRVHAGNAANPFLSCAYFITCGHPGGGDLASFSEVSAPSALKSTRFLTSLDPFDTRPHQLAANPFRMRSSTKQARNSFRIRTSKTKDLKLFRMNTSEKNQGASVMVNQKSDEGFLPWAAIALEGPLCHSEQGFLPGGALQRRIPPLSHQRFVFRATIASKRSAAPPIPSLSHHLMTPLLPEFRRSPIQPKQPPQAPSVSPTSTFDFQSSSFSSTHRRLDRTLSQQQC